MTHPSGETLEVIRGDTGTFEITLVDDSTPPVPINLNAVGIEVTFTVKARFSNIDSSALVQKTIGSGITLDATPGVAFIELDPADTDFLASYGLRYVYDVEVRDLAGRVSTPIIGILVIRPDVTLAPPST